ncbi:MAG TPA: DUF2188 domain-containing protein [Thermoplasmatales archaeon]|nr:DUF2188 domain-containing protein [Thermoplasmatales archaeon]
MSEIRKNVIGAAAFLLTLIGVEIYYFYSFLTHGLLIKYGYTPDSLLSFAPYLLVFLFLTVVVSLSLLAIVYGFVKRRLWTRRFALFFLVWAMLWPLWSIVVWNNVVEQFVLLIIYIMLILYLLSSYVKEYFKNIFRYGKYTLYKREVVLKSGKKLTIYFFSEHEPKSGTPCAMPEGYTVVFNPRSNMPYLEKYYPDAYKYGKYTLYKRTVTLKSGKTLTIYFFSEHKPKSGTPSPLPEGYVVGINPRSKMPYLKKKGTRREPEKVRNEKTVSSKKVRSGNSMEETSSRKPSNVIYVVNRPQPGHVRGDWAVRSHGKIYSHHRTKQTAIREARRIAREKEATVMVQNTDGTFSMGFKPRPKKR